MDHTFIALRSFHDLKIRNEIQSYAYSLQRLFKCPSGLTYFVKFLESIGKHWLIDFWMVVECLDYANTAEVRDIFTNYVEEGSCRYISLPVHLRLTIQDRVRDGELMGIYDEAKDFVFEFFQHKYFEEFQRSIFFKKHELAVLTGDVDLLSVLHVHSLFPHLLEMMESPSDAHRAEFVLAVETFEDEIDHLGDDDATADAMAVYDRFLSLQARFPVGLDDDGRRTVECLICTPNGKPDQRSFASPKQQAITYLSQKYLAEFVGSPAFLRHISFLSSCLELNVSPGLHNKKKEHNNVELRKNGKSRSLAEVDDMGRYRPLYDDSYAIPTTSKLKKTIQKYRVKGKEKEGEEGADDIARRIIQDVTHMVETGNKPN